MYGGMCCSDYAQSMLNLQGDLQFGGHKLTRIFIGNESLIQRGRNTIVHHFLKTDASHLMFIDADQGFRPVDIAKMLEADKPLIAGPVPMKSINWSKVKQGAVLNHKDLSRLTGIFNIHKLDGHKMESPNTPFQVQWAGTGFMLIRRDVFEGLMPHTEQYTDGSETIPSDEPIYNFFKVETRNGKLLGEDFFFCESYRDHGGEVWVAPWCEVGHFGSYLFNGQFSLGT
jgi:hypothetical protein